MSTQAATTATLAAPRGCSNFKLRQTARLLTRHYEAYLNAAGIKVTQYSLLSHVLSMQPVRAKDLADAMELAPSALTRNLQPLLEAGWVDAYADDADGRATVYRLSDSGAALQSQAKKAWRQAQLDFNARMGAARVALLHTLLAEANEALI